LSLKFFLLSLQHVVSFLLVSPLPAEEINIYFKTSPKVEFLRPYAGPANLSLLVTAADGRPLERGSVEIRFDAPKSGRFFSTDFPFVEGTRLTELRLPLRQGRANWNYLFPIRGEYNLAVEVESGDGKKARKDFQIKINENSYKWFLLGGFCLGLFLFGFVAGRVFTASSRKASLMVLVTLLALVRNEVSVLEAQEPAKEVGTARLEIEPATVGKPTRVRWSMDDGGLGSKLMIVLTLTITQLEENKVIFAVERVPVAGEFALNFQFVDGSEHRVTAIAELPGRAPVRTEQRVSVTAVEPPAAAALPPIAFFLFVIAFGLGAGRWSKRRLAT
jgi:hypothetical protein